MRSLFLSAGLSGREETPCAWSRTHRTFPSTFHLRFPPGASWLVSDGVWPASLSFLRLPQWLREDGLTSKLGLSWANRKAGSKHSDDRAPRCLRAHFEAFLHVTFNRPTGRLNGEEPFLYSHFLLALVRRTLFLILRLTKTKRRGQDDTNVPPETAIFFHLRGEHNRRKRVGFRETFVWSEISAAACWEKGGFFHF